MTPEETRTHSALHVLKGAVQSVLGAKLTTSTYVAGRHGRLTVRFERKPTEAEIQRIEEAANRKISEGAEIIEFEMDKEEALNHFGDEIYDLFAVPESVTRLKIVRIPDWNVNCCIENHVEVTSQIGRLKLGKERYRNSRKELELELDLVD